ncbi:LPS export ABC transporter permease LptF [Sesbania bispinosa]|nr:LPS export ABC transporter permease LptF [Sesbania bispinosa]
MASKNQQVMAERMAKKADVEKKALTSSQSLVKTVSDRSEDSEPKRQKIQAIPLTNMVPTSSSHGTSFDPTGGDRGKWKMGEPTRIPLVDMTEAEVKEQL